MSITVRFFASLSEELGFSRKSVDYKFPATPSLTIETLWHDVTNRPAPENLLCAVNYEYADFKRDVQDGDEVAFFPPVNGG